jgi:DNA repair protein RecN (Recombination protein N)
MLIRLKIHNYILIRDLEIEFGAGFSVITGETGSGKSVILGALDLILGQRADSDSLLDQNDKCIIEGTFRVEGYKLEEALLQNDLDAGEHLIIRREITPAGKSRAFINDTPVGLTLLKYFGERLINIHSQNTLLQIHNAAFQLAVLDSYAGISPNVSVYQEKFREHRKIKEQLSELVNLQNKLNAEKDYNQFLLSELQEARLIPGELKELEDQLLILRNAGEIKTKLLQIGSLLESGETSVVSLLNEANRSLAAIIRFDPVLLQFQERLHVNLIDIRDLASEIADKEDKIETNPLSEETLSQRIDLINRLLKKHHKKSTDELLEVLDELALRQVDATTLDEKIEITRSILSELHSELGQHASEISDFRRASKPRFEQAVTAILSKLGMPRAVFSIQLSQSDDFGISGQDEIVCLFSANQGIAAKEISESASGGELSRIMLAVKAMISQQSLLPTVIFDEIDSGVSGEIAGKVGVVLRDMAKTMQVIAITHLPQIAGMGTFHYLVNKLQNTAPPETTIQRLSSEERITEIAKMLSNDTITMAAVRTAKELLSLEN